MDLSKPFYTWIPGSWTKCLLSVKHFGDPYLKIRNKKTSRACLSSINSAISFTISCKPVSIPLAITPYYVHLPSYQILLFECFPISSFLNPFISIFLLNSLGTFQHPLTVCREMWRRTEIKISGYLFKRELWVINHFLYMSRFFFCIHW